MLTVFFIFISAVNQYMNHNPIGIFDSGIGGTSIWKEIHNLLPYEDTVYLSDSANAPYGERSKDEIIKLSIKNTERLLELGSKIIVVACNTATTNAIEVLRETYKIPFIGIEPAIKPAALQTKTKAIGILATKGTLSSELFSKTSDLYAKNIKVIEIIGKGLVELIESGEIFSDITKTKLKGYLEPMIEQKIDHLVLGCSHYPYLIPVLRDILSDNIKIIDSGEAVARQTKKVLSKENLLCDKNSLGSTVFYSNSDITVLKNILGSNCTMSQNCSVTFLDF